MYKALGKKLLIKLLPIIAVVVLGIITQEASGAQGWCYYTDKQTGKRWYFWGDC